MPVNTPQQTLSCSSSHRCVERQPDAYPRRFATFHPSQDFTIICSPLANRGAEESGGKEEEKILGSKQEEHTLGMDMRAMDWPGMEWSDAADAVAARRDTRDRLEAAGSWVVLSCPSSCSALHANMEYIRDDALACGHANLMWHSRQQGRLGRGLPHAGTL